MFFGMNNGFGGCNKGMEGGRPCGCIDTCTLLLILLLSNCSGFNSENNCDCLWYIILIFLLLGCSK